MYIHGLVQICITFYCHLHVITLCFLYCPEPSDFGTHKGQKLHLSEITLCQNILIFISADLSKLVERSIFVVTRGVQKSREEVRCLQHATYQNEPIIKDSCYIFTLTKFNGNINIYNIYNTIQY